MKSNISVKAVLCALALAGAMSPAAHADDSSMSFWNGDSYSAFNGGRNFPYGRPANNTAPSVARREAARVA